jgi:hypothetical protein
VSAAPRLIAAGLAAAEGLGFCALLVAELLAVGSGPVGVVVPAALFFGLCGAGLLWCARGLVAADSWSRGPVVAAQLLLLAIAWSYHRPYPEAAAALAVGAGICLVLLVLPSTSRELADVPPQSGAQS